MEPSFVVKAQNNNTITSILITFKEGKLEGKRQLMVVKYTATTTMVIKQKTRTSKVKETVAS